MFSTDTHKYTNTRQYSNGLSDWYAHQYRYTHSNADIDGDGDRDPDSDIHPDEYSYKHRNQHGDGHKYANSYADGVLTGWKSRCNIWKQRVCCYAAWDSK